MTKHTPSAGALPNASIDFDKVHSAAKAGKDDIYKGATSHDRSEPKSWPKEMRDAAAEQQEAEEAAAAGESAPKA